MGRWVNLLEGYDAAAKPEREPDSDVWGKGDEVGFGDVWCSSAFELNISP